MTDLEAAEHLDKQKNTQQELVHEKVQMIILKCATQLKVELMRARYERLISAIALNIDKKDGIWLPKAVELALKIKVWLLYHDK